MRTLPLLVLLAVGTALAAFPVTSYDYQHPHQQISPVAAGMGGLNLSLAGDPGLLYANPALLGQNKSTVVSVGFKLQDRDEIDAAQMLNAANILRKNQLVSLHVAAEGGAFAIRPLASIDEQRSWEAGGTVFTEDENYLLTAYQLGMAETSGKVTYGLGFKYLNGRLVYLRQHETELGSVTDEFVDDRLHGLSIDFGLTVDLGAVTWGITAWDVYSHLWWMHHTDRTITKRLGTTLGWQSGNTALVVGTQRQWNTASDQTYHAGVQHALSLGGDAENPRGLLIRAGAYSHDYEHAETVYSSLGLSFYMKAFRVDTSMATHDLALNNTRYLVTISMGM